MFEVNQPGPAQKFRPRLDRVIGLTVLILVLGTVAIGCTAAPAANAAVSPRVVVSTLSEPTLAPALPTDAPVPTVTPLPTQTPEPTATEIATATSTSLPSPTATRKPTLRSVAAPKPKPIATAAATAIAIRPLDFSFYWSSYCITRKTQHVTLMITAHGGQPPYAYYNDSILIDQGQTGSVRYESDPPAGNPVPFKIIVVDSAGQRYSEDFFYKSHLNCG